MTEVLAGGRGTWHPERAGAGGTGAFRVTGRRPAWQLRQIARRRMWQFNDTFVTSAPPK